MRDINDIDKNESSYLPCPTRRLTIPKPLSWNPYLPQIFVENEVNK